MEVRGEGSEVPWIAQIHELQAAASGASCDVSIQVALYYRPEDLPEGLRQAPPHCGSCSQPVSDCCAWPADPVLRAQAFHGRQEVFSSKHTGWFTASSLEGKCRVYSLRAYQVSSSCAFWLGLSL